MNNKFVVSAALATLLLAQLVHSATFTAVQSGEWTDPATWGGAVPGSSDDKVIPAGLNVRVTPVGELESFGVTTNFGTVEVRNNAFSNSGTFDNRNQLTISSAEFRNMPGATLVNTGRIFNQGNLNTYGVLVNDVTAVIDNRSALNAGNDGSIVNSGLILSAFQFVTGLNMDNGGTIVNQASGKLFIGDAVNHGRIENSGQAFVGKLANAEGASIANAGTMLVQVVLINEAGGSFGNSGNFEGWFQNESGAGARNQGTMTVRAFTALENAGSLDNEASLVTEGRFENTGFVQNTGTVASTFNLVNSGEIRNQGRISSTGQFSNSGSFFNFGGTLTNSGFGNNTGTIANLVSGLIANVGVMLNSSFIGNTLGGTISNSGSLRNTCTGVLFIDEGIYTGNRPEDLCDTPTFERLFALAAANGLDTNSLHQAVDLFFDVNASNNVAVCNKLSAFINQVNANKSLRPDQAQKLVSMATRLRATMSCR